MQHPDVSRDVFCISRPCCVAEPGLVLNPRHAACFVCVSLLLSDLCHAHRNFLFLLGGEQSPNLSWFLLFSPPPPHTQAVTKSYQAGCPVAPAHCRPLGYTAPAGRTPTTFRPATTLPCLVKNALWLSPYLLHTAPPTHLIRHQTRYLGRLRLAPLFFFDLRHHVAFSLPQSFLLSVKH